MGIKQAGWPFFVATAFAQMASGLLKARRQELMQALVKGGAKVKD